MGPYSKDLRERVAAAVDHGEGSQREIARRFRVSLTFVFRLLRRRRDADTLDPKPHGGCPPPTLGPDDMQRLAELIGKQPDATLEQLRERGGFQCSLTTIWRGLRRLGLTRKKKTLHADEQGRPDVQKKRRSFRRKVKQIEPQRLVFVDETGVTTAMTPAYAWAPRGERAYASAPGAWESVTVIAALGLDGVRAPLMFPGSTNAITFESYIGRCWCRPCTRGMWSSSTTFPLTWGSSWPRRSRARGRACCHCRRTARIIPRSRRCSRRSRNSSAVSRRGPKGISTTPSLTR
jgi:transposase